MTSAASWLPAMERCAIGSMCGLALFALLAHGLLLMHCSVPALLLPASLLLGILVPGREATEPVGTGAPRWLVTGSLLLLLAATAAVTHGSLATKSRCWDGIVAWDVKAAALAAAPTLQQPFFRDEGVLSHSLDYPLTLPLLLACGERLGVSRAALPCLYVLLLLLVGSALRRAGCGGSLAWLSTLGLGLVPALLNPHSGAVDSGYAEPLLLLATSSMAVGLLLRAPLPLVSGAILAVLGKPEGLLYAALPVAVLFVLGERQLLRAAVFGWLLGACVWLPLQHDLISHGTGGLPLALTGALIAAAASMPVLDHFVPARRRRRLILLAVILPALALITAAVFVTFGNANSTIGIYLADPARAMQRLTQLPRILGGWLQAALFKQFGLAFWLLLVVTARALARKRPFGSGSLGGFLGLGLLCVLVPFFLGPESDLQHHIASSMDRLQLHWLGTVFLFVASEIGQADLHLAMLDAPGQAACR